MAAKPKLYVEGADDLYTIAALLERHGVDMRQKPVEIKESGGVEGLLATMTRNVELAKGHAVGFVLDIDEKTANRWQGVADRLTSAGLKPPRQCPLTGYIDQVPSYRHPIGVWLMPDCKTDGGKLEDLIKTLVPKDDRLWKQAQDCSNGAKALGATYTDSDLIKAVAHTWLAWQKEPGKPFGTAITAHFLGHDSPEALTFRDWLRNLFGL